MTILNTLIDLLLLPFRHLPPVVGLVVFSVLLGAFVLLIFKATSNPDRIRQARNRALARILEMWLYRDDPWVALGAFGRVLWDNTRYLGVMVVPMLASMVPVLLLLAQAYDCFAVRPLRPGETTLLVAQLQPEAPLETLQQLGLSVGIQGATDGYCTPDKAALAAGTCVHIDSPPVRAPSVREIVWRLQANEGPGRRSVLGVTSADGKVLVEKQVCAGNGLTRVSQARVAGVWDWLLHPGERRLPANQPFARVEVLYPAAEYNFFGLRLGWLTSVLILSLLAGLALKKPLRVEF